MSITITTWNVNSLKVRQPQVLDFLKETENSILCLQELKMQEADIKKPARALQGGAGFFVKVFLPFRLFQPSNVNTPGAKIGSTSTRIVLLGKKRPSRSSLDKGFSSRC